LTSWKDTGVSEIAEQLNAIFPKEVAERLAFVYMLDDDKDELNEFLNLSGIRISMFKKPFIPPPYSEESSGEIILGNVMKGDQELHRFGISLEDVNRHVAIFSSTGMGKTTLIINILLQLLNHQDPIYFLATDWKRDLRHLIRRHPLWVLTWEWLRMNILQPPKGVSTKQWMMVVADLFSHVFGWFHASENYLLEFMDQLYKKHEGQGYPTLQELFDLIDKTEEKSRRYSEYRDVVRNRLASMLIVLEDIVDCRIGFPIEELLNHPVVIELDGLRRDEANFLVEFILAYIFTYRIANGHRGHLRHVLVFDEATRLFYKKRQYRETTIELGMPFIETVPQIIRDYSEGIIFALQEPDIASHSLMANSNVKIVGFLGEGTDIDAIARSLDLNDEERSAITKLECGEWLVKKPGTKPFLLRSPDYRLEKDVTDEELEERMRPVLSKLNEMVVPVRKSPERAISTKPIIPRLSGDAEGLLFNVNVHPFKGLSNRYKMLGLSGRKAEAAKNELLRKGLVEEVGVVLGSHRPVKFLVISGPGLEYLRNTGRQTGLWDYIGHVSFEHRLYQVLVAYSFRNAGHQAYVEKDLGDGRRLDILVVRDERKIGIEVELNPNIDLRKILKSMKDLDELEILCKDKNVLEKVRDTVERVVYPSLRKKMRLHVANEYLAKLRRYLKARKDGNESNYPKQRDPSS